MPDEHKTRIMLGCLQRKMTELATFCSQLNHNNFNAISHSLQAEPPFVFLVKKNIQVHMSKKPQTAGAYPSFISMKHGVLLLPPLDGMVVHRRVTPQQYVAGTHLYTWVKREKGE